MKNKITILDYGSGNIRSVYNLVEHLGVNCTISNKVSDILGASHLILPGVGAFGSVMGKIKSKIPIETLEKAVFEENKPFLGICIGMQVLADEGFEFGHHKGLGWISGSVKEIETKGEILPHIGWNNIKIVQESPLLAGLGSVRDFYFVHSYAYSVKDEVNVYGTVEYGTEFPVVVQKNNIFGVQFHPEKSQQGGKKLMKNFIDLK